MEVAIFLIKNKCNGRNMKKNYFLILITALFVFISCASNDKYSDNLDYSYEDDDYAEDVEEIVIHTTSENFLGDYDPIEMEELMFLQKSKKAMKPRQIRSVYLVPRNNTVELRFRDSANEVIIALNQNDRTKIIEACQLFLEQYEEKTLPHQKVNSKTAYYKGRCNTWYGVLSAATGCSKTDYYVNCEFINKRPYLILAFLPSRTDDGRSFTPKVTLYMSPTQIETFIQQMNQENLNSYVQTLDKKAYTY